eukprot:4453676-Amphidinium_carterae.1
MRPTVVCVDTLFVEGSEQEPSKDNVLTYRHLGIKVHESHRNKRFKRMSKGCHFVPTTPRKTQDETRVTMNKRITLNKKLLQ